MFPHFREIEDPEKTPEIQFPVEGENVLHGEELNAEMKKLCTNEQQKLKKVESGIVLQIPEKQYRTMILPCSDGGLGTILKGVNPVLKFLSAGASFAKNTRESGIT